MSSEIYHDIFNHHNAEFSALSSNEKKNHKKRYISEHKFIFHVIGKIINQEHCRL